MDIKSTALVPALYLTLGLSAVGIACVGFLIYRPDDGERATEQFSEATRDAQMLPVRNVRPTPSRDSKTNEAYAKAVQRVMHLEELLDKRTKLLERKSVLLKKKDAEYQELKREVDQYVMLLSQMPPESDTDDEPPGEADTEPTAGDESIALQEQLELLRTRLADTEAAERQLEEELSMLKTDLNDAYAEMAEQQLAAVFVDRETVVSQVAARLVRSMGVDAIPDVVALLGDRRAEVRAWAAGVLGRFGPAAEDAVPQLRELLADRDPRVRTAAENAIDLILN